MYIHVDISTVPPVVTLREADDLQSLKVVCPHREDALIDPAELRRLADRPDDAAWNEGFDAMLAYARSKGWVDGDGAVQAHIERD